MDRALNRELRAKCDSKQFNTLYKYLQKAKYATTQSQFEKIISEMRKLKSFKGIAKTYIEDNWLHKKWLKLWPKCYRMKYHKNMDTTNAVESWNK